jgi:hypothetical protein
MLGTFTVAWLITAAFMPAKASEAGQQEKSQRGTMPSTQPNIRGRECHPDEPVADIVQCGLPVTNN